MAGPPGFSLEVPIRESERKVWARRTPTGGAEVVIEVSEPELGARARPPPLGVVSAPERRELDRLRVSSSQRGVTLYARSPPSETREGGGRGPPTIPGESLREQQARLRAHGTYSAPGVLELPLGAGGRQLTREETGRSPEEFHHILLPNATFRAVQLYRRAGHEQGLRIRRSVADMIRAAAYALYSTRIRSFPGGFAAIPRRGYVATSTLFRGGVTEESYAPGQFPAGYVFTLPVGAPLAPVTTDTVAALIYLEGLWLEIPPEREPPPGRTYIANILSDYPHRRPAFEWRDAGHLPGTRLKTYAPPPGAAPKE